MKKISSLLILGLIAVVLSAAHAGYSYWQKGQISDEISRVQFDLDTYSQDDLKEKNAEVLASINAKRSLNVLELDLIRWSEVMKEVTRTLPKSRSGLLVDVTSYSGGKDSTVNMNVKTQGVSSAPYFDVADLIESFDESDFFTNVFVPSISSGNNAEGDEVLSFTISTQYVDAEE